MHGNLAIARGDKYKAMAAEAGYKVSGAAESAKAVAGSDIMDLMDT